MHSKFTRPLLTLATTFVFFFFGRTIAFAGIPAEGTCGDGIIDTAFGCISTEVANGRFFVHIFGVIVGLGGGIALLLILIGIFMIATSAGIPDKIKLGREIITSAASGLLFIIMSVVFLYLIGVKLLEIPGF